jgi:hypothetical protein
MPIEICGVFYKSQGSSQFPMVHWALTTFAQYECHCKIVDPIAQELDLDKGWGKIFKNHIGGGNLQGLPWVKRK